MRYVRLGEPYCTAGRRTREHLGAGHLGRGRRQFLPSLLSATHANLSSLIYCRLVHNKHAFVLVFTIFISVSRSSKMFHWQGMD